MKIKVMTHIVVGYPSLSESETIAKAMIKQGVDYLELQIPFSDPVADGPTIMMANQKSLANNTTPVDCFAQMQALANYRDELGSSTKLLFMTYYNIVFNYGIHEFCKKATELGVYGLIVPDMPVSCEQHENFFAACKQYNLQPIQIVSPLSTAERLKAIGDTASGFVYCVARTGTTGIKTEITVELQNYLEKAREYIKVPLALGFGISTVEDVKAASEFADIVVIGSHFIKLYDKEGTTAIEHFLQKVCVN